MLHKRPDGFHEIASLFQAISLGDFLTIAPHEGSDLLTCNDPSIPIDSTNLVLRAAELFRQKTGQKGHFSFVLDKRIPIQAGLGGGSSNAATTLWGLNELLGTGVKLDQLIEWAAELGSDVPFFLSHGRAYCEGRGERMTFEMPVDPQHLWIAKPRAGLSTPAVYQHVVIEKGPDPLLALLSHRTSAPLFFNDLEEPAFQLAPQLKEVKNGLHGLGFDQVHMTGSGTAFFCIGPVIAPTLSSIQFYPVQFIYRDKGWYKFSD